jgi:abequosyltransferase
MSAKINKILSITIPTFNRANFLDYSLSVHVPIAQEYSVPIYISDNASTDNTFDIVARWKKEYDYIYYSRNEDNKGPDINFEIAFQLPSSEYIWLIGDTSFISQDVFRSTVEHCKNNYDLIILNDSGRVKNLKSQLICDSNFLLSRLGWHSTQLACIIYNKRVVKNANFFRFHNTRFIHVGIVFEYLASQKDLIVWWESDLSIGNLKIHNYEKASWQKDTFDIWIRKWPNFVFSLPALYKLDNKLEMIQSHNRLTNIFGFKSLIFLRGEGFYSMSHFLFYNKYFKIALGKYSIFKFLFVALLPSISIRVAFKVYKKLSSLY